MKQFIKRRWPFLLGALSIVLFVGFLYHKGFRITYAPELENSWDAISAVATWAGVIMTGVSVVASFLAVWFAIRIPQKIAEQQNRISLFEKRFKVYSEMCNCESFSHVLESAQTKREIALAFLVAFEENAPITKLLTSENPTIETELYHDVMVKSREIIITLKQTRYLFARDTGLFEYIESVADKFVPLVTSLTTEKKNLLDEKNDYISLIDSQKHKQILSQMEKELQLHSII